MSPTDVPVAEYMSQPITAISLHQNLEAADRIMQRHRISALAVTADDESLAGVVTTTDLLRAGHPEFHETLRLPDISVQEVMSKPALTVEAGEPLSAAARLMLGNAVHRVFVTDMGTTVGVLSTHDVLRFVRDQRVHLPLYEVATPVLVSVKADDPLGLAIDRLEVSNKHGLVVMDDDWPVGVFAHRDALQARALDPKTPVEGSMDPRVLALPPTFSLHRAANQMLLLGARRIVMVGRDSKGVASELDFARAIC